MRYLSTKNYKYRRRRKPQGAPARQLEDRPEGNPLTVPLVCKQKGKTCNCPLLKHKVVTRGVPSYQYSDEPKLWIICEAPGEDEDTYAEPTVGSAGVILWKLLLEEGLTDCAISNTIRCRPPDNRKPTFKEIHTCSIHTLRELQDHQPQVVLLMGATAANTYLRTKKKEKIAKLRGWHKIPIGGSKTLDAYATYHPSAVHYMADILSTLKEDFTLVNRRLRKGTTKVSTIKYKKAYLDKVEKVKWAVDLTLRQKRTISFDFEGTSLKKVGMEVTNVTWGFGYTKQHMFELPLWHPQTPWSPQEFEVVLKEFRRLLTDKTKIIQFLCHNSKHELMCLMEMFGEGLDKPNFRITNAPIICSMQRAHAVDENRIGDKGSKYSLEALTNAWLGIPSDMWDDDVSEALYNQDERTGLNRAHTVDLKKLCRHASLDVACTLKLHQEINERAAAEGYDIGKIDPLLSNLPYLLAVIERNGIPVSRERLAALRSDRGILRGGKKELERELQSLSTVKKAVALLKGGAKPLFSKSGTPKFMVSKPDYKLSLFFDVLGLEPLSYGKEKSKRWPRGRPSMDKAFYAAYKEIKEIELVSEWTSLSQLENLYVEQWWDFANTYPDFRIRANFNGTGTNTGRLSSARPNLQQVPSGRTEAAKQVKSCFMPDSSDGRLKVIIAADYSQAEVRWLAQIAEEPVLADMFWRRKEMLDKYSRRPSQKLKDKIDFECDLHRSTAAEIFGIRIQDVDKVQRSGAKSTTFGIIYGMSEHGLAAALVIPLEEAAELRKKWLGRFSKANDWFEYTEEQAIRYGKVVSPLGRVRHLTSLLYESGYSKSAGHAKRVARNAPIQGTASDMNLWTAIKVQRYIDKYKKPWKLLALVHDSILAEVPIEDSIEYITIARKIANDPDLLVEFGVKIKVPQEMEFSIGFDYGNQIELSGAPVEEEVVIENLETEWRKAA